MWPPVVIRRFGIIHENKLLFAKMCEEMRVTMKKGKQKNNAVNEKFQLFWNEYHSITQLPKENIAKAQREWKKLSDKEQQLAIDNIEVYYFHQTNVNFLLHAGSYLSNKAFLNEYTY